MQHISMQKNVARYGLQERKIPVSVFTAGFGEIMIASDDSKGVIEMIGESKGKKITNISGGSKKLFIFEEENQNENVVTALHPESEDYLEYNGEEIQSIDQIVLALQGNKIKEIQSGKEHNVVLTHSGLLFSFGKGNFGSLGLGGTIFAPSPLPVLKLSNKIIVSISCGLYHTLALSDIGDVYSWGRGFEGQLGLLDGVESISSPSLIPHFFKYNNHKDVRMLKKTQIISIACGSYHSIAIDENRNVYCWGEAMYGQTGNGKKTKEPLPVKLQLQSEGNSCLAKQVSGGFGHTLCLTTEGDIFAWGLNIKGQLGLNDLPQQIKSSEKDIQYKKAVYFPTKLQKARDKSDLPKFQTISCGFTSSYALDLQGNLWSWGGGNLGVKDIFLQRGPLQVKETQSKKFTHLFANQNSLVLFCPFTPIYFKPALISSAGQTQLTFFGNGFTSTGKQSIRFSMGADRIDVDLNYDEKTSTFYCKSPSFQKINKKYEYPSLCKVQISLDKAQYFPFNQQLLVYSSKLQIQSIEPNCGSVLGGSQVKLYMPLPPLVLSYLTNITIGFKNTNTQKKQSKMDATPDWICTEGVYQNQVITCKIPNITHFDHEIPFYMLDVSLNSQQFTDLPHTFRYYFISDTKLTPSEGEDDAEPECIIHGTGLFDTPNKHLKVKLSFQHNQKSINCQRTLELKWNKQDKNFSFKIPKLSWIIGDHEITPELIEQSRKHPVIVQLFVSKTQSIDVGVYRFVAPPPPPEPEEDKKDPKKDAKKGAKK